MKDIFRQNQLFTFLLYCNGQGLEKEILDCGAGGNLPPLAIFNEQGYKVHGIEIDDEQLEKANKFSEERGINLNIQKGDMKDLPYEDNSMSYIYSYNSIFHMSKEEVSKSIGEIARVLKPKGLSFVNFASTDDFRVEVGEKVGDGEVLLKEHGEMVLHSFFDRDEAEEIFKKYNLDIIYKEVRIRTVLARNGEKITVGFIDYIVEKKESN